MQIADIPKNCCFIIPAEADPLTVYIKRSHDAVYEVHGVNHLGTITEGAVRYFDDSIKVRTVKKQVFGQF